jgi:hypothetical protein
MAAGLLEEVITLSGAEWDNREWQSRSEIREQLFWLGADAVLSLG